MSLTFVTMIIIAGFLSSSCFPNYTIIKRDDSLRSNDTGFLMITFTGVTNSIANKVFNIYLNEKKNETENLDILGEVDADIKIKNINTAQQSRYNIELNSGYFIGNTSRHALYEIIPNIFQLQILLNIYFDDFNSLNQLSKNKKYICKKKKVQQGIINFLFSKSEIAINHCPPIKITKGKTTYMEIIIDEKKIFDLKATILQWIPGLVWLAPMFGGGVIFYKNVDIVLYSN